MHPSPAPNLRLQQLRDGNPTLHRKIKHPEYLVPPETLLILRENGEGETYEYNTLLNTKFRYGEELNILTLQFMSETVILRGIKLDMLFLQFAHIKPSMIRVYNPRYNVINNAEGYMVVEAAIRTEAIPAATIME